MNFADKLRNTNRIDPEIERKRRDMEFRQNRIRQMKYEIQNSLISLKQSGSIYGSVIEGVFYVQPCTGSENSDPKIAFYPCNVQGLKEFASNRFHDDFPVFGNENRLGINYTPDEMVNALKGMGFKNVMYNEVPIKVLDYDYFAYIFNNKYKTERLYHFTFTF